MILKRYLPAGIRVDAYFHLVWLLFLVSQPLFDPATTWVDWALIPVFVALFLPVYFRTWTGSRGQRLTATFLLCLLGLAVIPFNSGAGGFFIYASAAAGHVMPPRRAMLLIFGIGLLVPLSSLLIDVPYPEVLYNVIPISLMTLLVGGANIFEAQRSRANRRLRLAHDEIERLATIAERERIARDLHDLLGHTLSMITLKSELAARLATSEPERAGKEMRDVEEISRDALSQVRSAVQGYRSRGLQAELQGAERALAAAGIESHLEVDSVSLPAGDESVLALAVRESVTNVIRHSRATLCTIRLKRDGEMVRLQVEDDGVGGRSPEGSGLRGMRDRVEARGGSLDRSTEGGTTISVYLPLDSSGAGTKAPARVATGEGVT